jgi:hypothetical protein
LLSKLLSNFAAKKWCMAAKCAIAGPPGGSI